MVVTVREQPGIQPGNISALRDGVEKRRATELSSVILLVEDEPQIAAAICEGLPGFKMTTWCGTSILEVRILLLIELMM